MCSSCFLVNLQKPNISLSGLFDFGHQGSVITRGHSFTITCSSESQYSGGFFSLFSGSNIISSEPAVNHSAVFIFPEADYSHEGNYSCVYEVIVSSRKFDSDVSDLLLITIRVNLQKPNISLSGLFDFGHQGSVVARGHSFTITCSSESQYSGGFFSLFSGSNIISREPAVSHSAVFIFPDADYSHEGNYSCVYEVFVSSRNFRSVSSNQLLITIRASMGPVIAALVSAVLLIFTALIMILLMKTRQNHKKKTHKVRFIQDNMHSHAVNEDRYEEDDEDDYVNAKCFDEADYVNINVVEPDASSDESERDYVNINTQRNAVDDTKNRY
nr:uncharacterized protein LOC129435874 [Misgurnus anguillicaudatus]